MTVDELVRKQSGRHMTESGHQKCLFRWAEMAKGTMPELHWLHSVPNGGLRDKITAAVMVAEGLKAGVPDVFLDVPRKGFHGLRIELKTPRIPAIKGVRLSKAAGSTTELQDEWLAHYRLHGYAAHVAYGWDDAMQIIKDYLAA